MTRQLTWGRGYPDPFDALQSAPSPMLDLANNRGRTIARMDITELLAYFARMQALSVIHLWDAPQIVLDYLMTGDERVEDAARYAALIAWEKAIAEAKRAKIVNWCAAARDAAKATMWASQKSGGWEVARESAKAAVRDAAGAEAWINARDPTWWDCVWREKVSAAGHEFNQLVYECFEDYL